MSCIRASAPPGGIDLDGWRDALADAIRPQVPSAFVASLLAGVLFAPCACAQAETDTIVNVYQLGEVVVHGGAKGLRLEGFFRQVMEDTTFYHAFLNTKYHAHAVKSERKVRDKKSRETAGLYREGRLVRDGALAVGTQMTCTLSADHRVVDGAVGAGFLATLRGLVEAPLSLLA